MTSVEQEAMRQCAKEAVDAGAVLIDWLTNNTPGPLVAIVALNYAREVLLATCNEREAIEKAASGFVPICRVRRAATGSG